MSWQHHNIGTYVKLQLEDDYYAFQTNQYITN